MPCDFELKDKLPEYIKGVLPQAETQRVERHIAGCDACAQEVEQIMLLLPELKGYSDQHVPAETLVDFVQSHADDFRRLNASDWNKERLKEHLEICEQCAFEVKTLQALENDFNPYTGKPIQEANSSARFFVDIKKFLSPSRLKFALAAAVVLLIAIPLVDHLLQTDSQKSPLPQVALLEVDQYTSSLLEGEMVTRGTETEQTNIFYDPQEAALDQFVRNVKTVEGKITAIAGKAAFAGPSRTVLLLLRTKDGKIDKSFVASIPRTHLDSTQSAELQAWLMALPNMVLYRVDMSLDSVMTLWDLNLSSQVCVLFTYRSGEGYKSSSPLCTEIIR